MNDKQIEQVKTDCCKSEWYIKKKLDYRCKKCDKDFTYHILCLYLAQDE